MLSQRLVFFRLAPGNFFNDAGGSLQFGFSGALGEAMEPLDICAPYELIFLDDHRTKYLAAARSGGGVQVSASGPVPVDFR